MKPLFISPWFAAVIWAIFTICIVFMGLLSDIVLENIKAIDQVDSITDIWNVLPWWQIILFLVTAIMLALSVAQKAITQAEQKEDIKNLEEIVRTLPNITAISHSGSNFAKRLSITLGAAQGINEDWVTKDSIQKAIRDTLDVILTITKSFDDAENEDYAANIMRLYSFSSLENKERFKDSISFNKLGFSHLDGVLSMQPLLSTTSTSKAEPDPSLQDLVFNLPVHKDEKHVLPGAPKALRKNTMMIIHSMDELKNVIKQADMLKDTRDEILEHFNKTDIKAFLSVPISLLVHGKADKPDSKIIAVLNVHKLSPHIIRTDMARDDDGMHSKSKSVYLSMVQPYLGLLGHLMSFEEQVE